MQFKDILYEVKGDYAHVTINRPKVLNAFTPETLQELKTALDAAEKDKEVGVIVLSGAGDRAFCSGGDMNWESSKEFQDLVESTTKNLQWLHQTQNDVLTITGSGTAAMEAGIINTLS